MCPLFFSNPFLKPVQNRFRSVIHRAAEVSFPVLRGQFAGEKLSSDAMHQNPFGTKAKSWSFEDSSGLGGGRQDPEAGKISQVFGFPNPSSLFPKNRVQTRNV